MDLLVMCAVKENKLSMRLSSLISTFWLQSTAHVSQIFSVSWTFTVKTFSPARHIFPTKVVLIDLSLCVVSEVPPSGPILCVNRRGLVQSFSTDYIKPYQCIAWEWFDHCGRQKLCNWVLRVHEWFMTWNVWRHNNVTFYVRISVAQWLHFMAFLCRYVPE